MKRLIIGGILLIILGIVAAVMVMNNEPSTVRTELADFALENPEAVTKIILKNELGEQVILEKQENYWTVNSDFKARPDAIDILLETMTDLSIKSPVSQSAMTSWSTASTPLSKILMPNTPTPSPPVRWKPSRRQAARLLKKHRALKAAL